MGDSPPAPIACAQRLFQRAPGGPPLQASDALMEITCPSAFLGGRARHGSSRIHDREPRAVNPVVNVSFTFGHGYAILTPAGSGAITLGGGFMPHARHARDGLIAAAALWLGAMASGATAAT